MPPDKKSPLGTYAVDVDSPAYAPDAHEAKALALARNPNAPAKAVEAHFYGGSSLPAKLGRILRREDKNRDWAPDSDPVITRREGVMMIINGELRHDRCFSVSGGSDGYAAVTAFEPANEHGVRYFIHHSNKAIATNNIFDLNKRVVMLGALQGEIEGEILQGHDTRRMSVINYDLSSECTEDFEQEMLRRGVPKNQIHSYAKNFMYSGPGDMWSDWNKIVRGKHNDNITVIAINIFINYTLAEIGEALLNIHDHTRPGDNLLISMDCSDEDLILRRVYGDESTFDPKLRKGGPLVPPFKEWFADTVFSHVCQNVIGIVNMGKDNLGYRVAAPRLDGGIKVTGLVTVAKDHPPLELVRDLPDYLKSLGNTREGKSIHDLFMDKVKVGRFGGSEYELLPSWRFPEEKIVLPLFRDCGWRATDRYDETGGVPGRPLIQPGTKNLFFNLVHA